MRSGEDGATNPDYGKASTKVSTPMLAFDCEGSARELCEKEDVTSYPTIKYFTDDDYEAYTGGRSEAEFIKFLSENTEDTDLVDDDGDDEAEEEEEEEEAEEEEAEDTPVDMKKDEL